MLVCCYWVMMFEFRMGIFLIYCYVMKRGLNFKVCGFVIICSI